MPAAPPLTFLLDNETPIMVKIKTEKGIASRLYAVLPTEVTDSESRIFHNELIQFWCGQLIFLNIHLYEGRVA
jgi:hypothetical protein